MNLITTTIYSLRHSTMSCLKNHFVVNSFLSSFKVRGFYLAIRLVFFVVKSSFMVSVSTAFFEGH